MGGVNELELADMLKRGRVRTPRRRRVMLGSLIVLTFVLMAVWPREPVTLVSMLIVGALVAFDVDEKGARR